MKRLLYLSTLLIAGTLPSLAATSDLGNIVFIGDSITQSNGTSAVSYRYPLWKHFVDSGATYSPVGSMNFYWQDGRPTTSTLAPTYRGYTFDNTNEGHFGWDIAWLGNGEGGKNRANTWSVSGGLSEWMDTYTGTPNTATILMGVNDLSRGTSTYTDDAIIANTRSVVDTLLTKAPSVEVHIFSVLPTAQSAWGSGDNRGASSPRDAIAQYNAKLKTAAEGWSAENSHIHYHDITAGFDPVAHTYDQVHPKAQGELIIAGNIARALGLEQRTAGRQRRDASLLASQVSFSSQTSGNGVVARITTGTSTKDISNTSSAWTVNEAGHIVVDSALAGGSDLRTTWNDSGGGIHESTFSITLKMMDAGTNSAKNYLGIFSGNGLDQVGILYIGESGIYWGGTATSNLLYGQTVDAYKDKFMTADAGKTLRIAWLDGTGENAATSGFYIWLEDQLIGEALSGSTNEGVLASYKNSLLVGDIGGSYVTKAEIFDFSFDAETAWAPASSSSIPEPSAFALVVGVSALALVVMRRRRRETA